MTTIDYLIMQRVQDFINDIFKDDDPKSPAKPRWIEKRPRNEDFADKALSIWISTGDPENPGSWQNEAVVAWPVQKGAMTPEYSGRNFNEIGGGQGFYHRFTIGFFLLYTEIGKKREVALTAGNTMINRVHSAFVNIPFSQKYFMGLKDDYRAIISHGWDKAVRKIEMTPSGSEEDTIMRGKIWLEFIVYHEST